MPIPEHSAQSSQNPQPGLSSTGLIYNCCPAGALWFPPLVQMRRAANILPTRLSLRTAPWDVAAMYSVTKARFSRGFLLFEANKTVTESFFVVSINMNWKWSCKVWIESSWIKGEKQIVASCLVTSQSSFLFKRNQLGLLTYFNGVVVGWDELWKLTSWLFLRSWGHPFLYVLQRRYFQTFLKLTSPRFTHLSLQDVRLLSWNAIPQNIVMLHVICLQSNYYQVLIH